MSTEAGRAQYVIGVFDTFSQLQQAISELARQGFPLEQLAVVARRLRVVPGEPPAMDRAVAALSKGMLAGTLVGLALGLFDRSDPARSAVLLASVGCLIGAVVGVGVAVAASALTRRRRAAGDRLAASRYEVLIDDVDDARAAARLLVELTRRPPDSEEDPTWPTAATGRAVADRFPLATGR